MIFFSQDSPNSDEFSVSITLDFWDGSGNFRRLFSVSCEFCFYTDKIDPLSGEILYHDSVPMIVPGFTSFVEDFVIRCY